jgi:DNA (cytosine-5)-methyltransferase 1
MKFNDEFLDRFKVVNPAVFLHTMVAHIAKDGHHYIYPSSRQVRSLSVREAVRIQSFPDDYCFEGGRGAAFRQIGNAVPPLMAKEIAVKIKEKINA